MILLWKSLFNFCRKQKRAHVFHGLFLGCLDYSVQLLGGSTSSLESNKEAGMPKPTLLLGLLMICMTLLIFTWMVRGSLCELRFRQKQTELAAVLAYEVKR